tara:strand:+ start:252 stop:833 length:582 start_codon:yes stop_codon:yes gene_type:complete
MRECTKCKEQKELKDFNKCKDGLQYECKSCRVVGNLNRSRTKEGKLKLIYNTQVSKSKKRGYEPPTYTKQEFIDKYINNDTYLYHYCNWVVGGYKKEYSPSFDRLDDYKGYSFDNIQIMYWFENDSKGRLDRKNGVNNKHSKAVVGTNIKTGEKIEFHSAMEAERNGFNHGNIASCCTGKVRQHKGYTWKHKV